MTSELPHLGPIEHFARDPDPASFRARPEWVGAAVVVLLGFVVAAALITILVLMVVS